ncbi:serine protease [Cyclospora cayetanensis]|uniref:subtilisin n=1 Tax=Cyclospora cayetanensis TaxID=88456 RepID=A0A1D3CUR0_9EIME|nr:serine protease [Cyclospora cayetanensis]
MTPSLGPVRGVWLLMVGLFPFCFTTTTFVEASLVSPGGAASSRSGGEGATAGAPQSVSKGGGLASLLHLDNVLPGSFCDEDGTGEIFENIEVPSSPGTSLGFLSFQRQFGSFADSAKAFTAAMAAHPPPRRLDDAAEGGSAQAPPADEITLREVLRKLQEGPEAVTMLLGWDYSCLSAQRLSHQPHQTDQVEVYLHLDDKISAADSSPPAPNEALQLLYTHGVLLRDVFLNKQQPDQQHLLEDRLFGLESLSRLFSHNFDLGAAAAAAQRKMQNVKDEDQPNLQRGDVPDEAHLPFLCSTSTPSACRELLLESLVQHQHPILISRYLSSLAVEVVTFSNLKPFMQEKSLQTADDLLSHFKGNTGTSCVSAVSLDTRGKLTGSLPRLEAVQSVFTSAAGRAASASRTAGVQDPNILLQWHLRSSEGLYNLAADKAWQQMKTASSPERQKNVVVALLDTGCGPHEDIDAILWTNSAEQCDDGQDHDNNGYINDCKGWDFVEDTNNIEDIYGHGTAVAALIAASFDAKGGRGKF